MKNNGLTVENLYDGRFLAKSDFEESKIKVFHNGKSLTYDINQNFQFYPFNLGDGLYEIYLYKRVVDRKYSQEGKISLQSQLKNKNDPFLSKNQYINYEDDLLKNQITEWSKDSIETKIEKIKDYIQKNFFYDFVKAITVKPNVLPNIKECLEKKMGICQDLSALMVAILRLLGIPARMVIGYINSNNYHAWVEYYINDKWEMYDPTISLIGQKNKKNIYSPERYY